ncbi:glycosyltransferase [Candidatus Woesebacteria bacterium]|nr:glycosyltransferase [Candidatus Woesebacteria bacterium]
MKNRRDVSLVLACFNEVDVFVSSVERIVETLSHSNLKYEIIFVDDKSIDDTRHLIARACKKYPHTSALFHRVNCGRGKTVTDGFMKARGTVVGFIDIDCEVGPEYIPQLVSTILERKADVAIGKRIYRSSPGSLIREILSRGYQWLSDALIGTGGLDTETGYKFFRRSKVLPLLARTLHTGWFWDTEIMVRAKRAGLSICEVPVLFLRRFDKQSSVHIIRDTADYLVNLWSFRKQLSRE